MRHRRPRFRLVTLALLGSVSTGFAYESHPAGSPRFVGPEEPVLRVPIESLLVSPDPKSVLLEVGPAIHGLVEIDGDSLVYTPDDGFWTVGSELLPYSVWQAGEVEPEVVHGSLLVLSAVSRVPASFVDGFELGIHPSFEIQGDGGKLRVVDSAAIGGLRGLEVEVHTGDGAWLALTELPSVPPGNLGDGRQASQVKMKIRLPNVTPMQPYREQSSTEVLSLFTASLPTGPEVLGIELDVQDSLALRARIDDDGDGTFDFTPSMALHAGVHSIALEWWTDEYGEGGLMLVVDDQLSSTVQEISTRPVDELELAFGAIGPITFPTEFTFDLDDIEIRQRSFCLDCDLACAGSWADDFEVAALRDWDYGGDGELQVNDRAALSGSRGLEATTGGGPSTAYVLDQTLSPGRFYGVRFRYDASEAAIGAEVGELQLLSARGEVGSSHERFSLWLTWDEHAATLHARSGTELACQIELRAEGLLEGAHEVEMLWRSASGPQADDGYLRLWIDGDRIGACDGLANPDSLVRELALGVVAASASANGPVFVDEISTWNCAAGD